MKCGKRDNLEYPDPGLYGLEAQCTSGVTCDADKKTKIDVQYCYDPNYENKNTNNFIKVEQPTAEGGCPSSVGNYSYLCPSSQWETRDLKNQICINSTVELAGQALADFLNQNCPITGMKVLR